MTYETYQKNFGPYQEGNLASIDITDIVGVDMAVTSVTAVLANKMGKKLWQKSSADVETEVDGEVVLTPGGIVIDGQSFSIELLPADTTGIPGVHIIEIDFINASLQPFLTIRGTFTIEAQVNKYIA